MGKRSRVHFLGCKVDRYDFEQTVERIEEYTRGDEPIQIVTLNPEIVMAARQDEQLRELIGTSQIITPDGISIVWATKKFKDPVPERITGIDLMDRLCREAAANNWRVYLLGGAPHIAEKAAENLQKKYPGLLVAGTHDGYFSEDETPELVRQIKEEKTDLLFVGMGAPKQEFWIRRNMWLSGAKVSMGVGGSFDVFSGTKKRAPQWAIRMHLEWLYRLVKEPSRLKRQLILPKFVWLVLKESAKVPAPKKTDA